jgi:CrcB protein
LGKGWPYDILLINLSGAFLLAFVTMLADAALWVSPTRRLFLGVGFLGAYTTFSSLVLGDLQLILTGNLFPALAYLLLSWFGGLLAIFAGATLGRSIVSRRLWARTRSVPSAELHGLDLTERLFFPSEDEAK